MASKAADKTLADFIAGALNPPLIMALVGSLVFFLQEILYGGARFSGPLQWILFFFVFGAVLIARMSMQQGELSSKSTAYGVVLGGVVWLGLRQYVDYSENPALAARSGFINLGLIVLIWWSAHRLTLDCTFLSEESAGQGAGAGLLDAAGFGKSTSPEKTAAAQEKPKKSKKSKKKTPEEQPGLTGWWARFLRYREQRQKQPQVLGVWVVFFSLAALPLFGLGQAQIPPSETARRSYAFWLLLIYVFSGLGLLLTTSFLSLRMYLRERSVTMPAGITLGWLFLGALLIFGHLFVSSLLPRPTDPQPLWNWTGLTGKQAKDPAHWSPMKDKGDEATGKRGQTTAKKADGDQDKDDPDAAARAGKSGKKTKAKSGKGRSGDKNKDGGSAEKGNDSDQKDAERQGDKTDDADKKDAEQAEEEEGGGEEPAPAAGENNPLKLPSFLAPLSPVITGLLQVAKWIVIFLVVVLIIAVLGRSVLQFLANFTFWAQKMLAFFDNLFQKDAKAGPREEPDKRPPPRPFASYGNPFDNGRAREMSPAELVRYSFATLEAWSREHNLARGDGETPMELAGHIGLVYPDLGEECRKLAGLYNRLAYSTDTLANVKIDSLCLFWTSMCNVPDDAQVIDYESPP